MLYRADYGEARARYIEYLKLSQRHDLPVNIGEGLIGLAAAMVGLHQYECAALLAGAGQARFDAVVYKVPPSDRIEIDPLLVTAHEQLGKERFEALAAEGRAMTLEQAITYALEDSE